MNALLPFQTVIFVNLVCWQKSEKVEEIQLYIVFNNFRLTFGFKRLQFESLLCSNYPRNYKIQQTNHNRKS